MEYAKNFRFTREDIDYLMELTGNDGAPLYTSAYLKYLRDLDLGPDVEIEAVAEGRVVCPNTPLLIPPSSSPCPRVRRRCPSR